MVLMDAPIQARFIETLEQCLTIHRTPPLMSLLPGEASQIQRSDKPLPKGPYIKHVSLLPVENEGPFPIASPIASVFCDPLYWTLAIGHHTTRSPLSFIWV